MLQELFPHRAGAFGLAISCQCPCSDTEHRHASGFVIQSLENRERFQVKGDR